MVRSPRRRSPPLRGRDLLDRVLAGHRHDPVTHVEQVPPRPGRPADWPDWAPELLVDRFRARGIVRPWEHQAAAAALAHAGQSVVISTGTASGKSLAYQLPVLSTLLTDGKTAALYLSPTKALAADQLRSLRSLVLPDIRAAAFDGDTEPSERDWVRAHSRLVLTNPDMLHRGILPSHARWATFLRRLQYVVVDECHTYRGVFGSHVAHVLRRLRRICASYGAYPTFVLASATVASPAISGRRLTGLDVEEVTDDASPRGSTAFALWEPPLTEAHGEHGAPVRRGGRRRGGPAAGRPGRRGRPSPGLRPVPPGRGGAGAHHPAAPGQRRARARRPGRGVPGRLPAGGAPRSGGSAGRRHAARRGRDQRARARHRHRRAGRRGARRLPRDAGLAVAAGRPGRARRARGAGGVRGARRPAGHLPRPPP